MDPAIELFNPMPAFGRTIPSRVLLAPINTGFAERGRPTDDLLRFHEARSGPGIGISMVGNVAVSDSAATNSGTLVLNASSELDQYSRIASRIKSRGSLAGIQLASSPALLPNTNWVAQDLCNERQRLTDIILAVSELTLAETMDQFTDAANLAAQANYDVIQIHAAHGYLLSLLLNPLTNARSGRFALFGHWLLEFLQSLIQAARDCLVSFRLSLFSGLKRSRDEELESATTLSAILAANGVHFIDYSAGFYTVDRRLIYPGVEKGPLPYLSVVLTVTQGISCVCGVSGNVSDLRLLPSLPSNCVVSVGRSLIADCDFVGKSQRGDYDQINRCRRTGHCHYFSRGKGRIECGANPTVGKVL